MSVFSVRRMREAGEKPDANIISGPYDIAVVEQLRAETFAADPALERVPTDVFVWNRSEPENRAVTHAGLVDFFINGYGDLRWLAFSH